MSSNDIAVAVRGLSKSYVIAHDNLKHYALTEAITHRIKHPFYRPQKETFWALKDIEFDIKKGDVVGIIGRNGAGKSTLLKVLSQITEPTTGEVRLYGRVGSLLEVGTGFHPELTGRENIYLNGAILGMRKREIDRQFDEIVAFAEVEKFLDTPVKRYSSGMYVRLAFAVAAHLNPEILVVDEVLSVGDAAFQKKCLGKMEDVSKQDGKTVLFVSHNMAAISSLCKTGIYLLKGTVEFLGDIKDTVKRYQEEVVSQDRGSSLNTKHRSGSGLVRICNVKVTSDKVDDAVISGSKMLILLDFEAQEDNLPIRFHISIFDNFNSRILSLESQVTQEIPYTFPRKGRITMSFREDFSLFPNRYSMNIAVYVYGELVDYLQNALVFDVQEGDFFGNGKNSKLPAAILYKNKWDLISDPMHMQP